jgi:hypothetical protein
LFQEFDADPVALADRFFALMEDLEKLLKHPVDLVSGQDDVNPYFLEVANRYRITLYAASHQLFFLGSVIVLNGNPQDHFKEKPTCRRVC